MPIRALSLAKDFFVDGYKLVGLSAPLLSISFTVAKYFGGDRVMELGELSYAWALLPLLIWSLIAYVRRWLAHQSNLSGSIEQYSQGVDPSGEMVGMMNVTIRNKGTPSVIDNWAIVLIRPSGKRIQAKLWAIETVALIVGGQKITISKSDAIYEKTATTPIPQGGKVGGWLQFKVPQLTRNDLSHENRFELSFRDVFGRQYTILSKKDAAPIEKFKYVPDGSGGLKAERSRFQ